MSDIESLIDGFNDMCGEPRTEMGTLARWELRNIRRQNKKLNEELGFYRERFPTMGDVADAVFALKYSKASTKKLFVVYFHNEYGDYLHAEKTKIQANNVGEAKKIFFDKYGSKNVIHDVEVDPYWQEHGQAKE